MGQISEAAAKIQGIKALESLAQVNKQLHQIGGQIQQTASVYMQLRAVAEDQDDEDTFDASLASSITSVKTQIDAIPAAERAMIHSVLNGVFGSDLETNAANL